MPIQTNSDEEEQLPPLRLALISAVCGILGPVVFLLFMGWRAAILLVLVAAIVLGWWLHG